MHLARLPPTPQKKNLDPFDTYISKLNDTRPSQTTTPLRLTPSVKLKGNCVMWCPRAFFLHELSKMPPFFPVGFHVLVSFSPIISFLLTIFPHFLRKFQPPRLHASPSTSTSTSTSAPPPPSPPPSLSHQIPTVHPPWASSIHPPIPLHSPATAISTQDRRHRLPGPAAPELAPLDLCAHLQLHHRLVIIVLNGFQDQVIYTVTPTDVLQKYFANRSKTLHNWQKMLMCNSIPLLNKLGLSTTPSFKNTAATNHNCIFGWESTFMVKKYKRGPSHRHGGAW